MSPIGERPQDPLMPVVMESIGEILAERDVVIPLDVLVRLELVDAEAIEAWRRGGLPYLERGISAGLARVARILRLVREHALALGLEPTRGKYVRRAKGGGRPLRFSKRGDRDSELAYATHFVRSRVASAPGAADAAAEPGDADPAQPPRTRAVRTRDG